MYPSLVVATAASCSWLAESSRRQAGSWNQASTTTRSAVLSATTVRPRSFLSPEQTTITGSSSANYKPQEPYRPLSRDKNKSQQAPSHIHSLPFRFPCLIFFFLSQIQFDDCVRADERNNPGPCQGTFLPRSSNFDRGVELILPLPASCVVIPQRLPLPGRLRCLSLMTDQSRPSFRLSTRTFLPRRLLARPPHQPHHGPPSLPASSI